MVNDLKVYYDNLSGQDKKAFRIELCDWLGWSKSNFYLKLNCELTKAENAIVNAVINKIENHETELTINL